MIAARMTVWVFSEGDSKPAAARDQRLSFEATAWRSVSRTGSSVIRS